MCGIPASAAAISFNFAALNVGAAGDLRVFPAGGATPLVSTLNYNASTPNIANAAVVPLGVGGAITVLADAVSIDLIIDVNGYYAPAGVGTHNTFLGLNAGNFTMTGDNNTGLGYNALNSNTTGGSNTASGVESLLSNTTGYQNTATGQGALFANTMGAFNTALGASALYSNTGDDNTALGGSALFSNTSGINNTASGDNALAFNTTGNDNIAFGYRAGSNLTTGHDNICIGNFGVTGESDTIRIGTAQTATFIAGVNGVTTGGTGTPVLIDANGQLDPSGKGWELSCIRHGSNERRGNPSPSFC